MTEVAQDCSDSALAARTSGAGAPVTVVHGFAQTGECIGPLLAALTERYRVTRVDAPGHGGSARHGDAPMDLGAEMLARTGGAGAYIGYSMGGRLCLRAALSAPEQVGALVLIGATAGLDDPGERERRRTADHALADRLEHLGLDAFLQEWLDLPMFAGLPRWARFDEERRTNTARGLAGSLRHAGTGSMEPLWERLHRIDVPVLCVSGELDPRYGALAERLVGSIGPNARHVVIRGAGHAAHLERPDPTIEAVLELLTRW